MISYVIIENSMIVADRTQCRVNGNAYLAELAVLVSSGRLGRPARSNTPVVAVRLMIQTISAFGRHEIFRYHCYRGSLRIHNRALHASLLPRSSARWIWLPLILGRTASNCWSHRASIACAYVPTYNSVTIHIRIVYSSSGIIRVMSRP